MVEWQICQDQPKLKTKNQIFQAILSAKSNKQASLQIWTPKKWRFQTIFYLSLLKQETTKKE